MTVTVQHVYSPDQYSRAVELWRRLLDCSAVRLTEDRGNYTYPTQSVDDEELYGLILADGQGNTSPNGLLYYPVTVTLVSYSDYGGSDYDAANVRYLRDNYPDWVDVTTEGRHGEGSASVTLGELPESDTEDGLDRLDWLVREMEGLSDSPLFDEDTHSAYVDELAEEAWGQYLGNDVLSEVETALGLDDTTDTLDVFGYSEDDIRHLYYGCDETYFRAETATSVVNDGHDEAIACIADAIIKAWRTPYVCPSQLALL